MTKLSEAFWANVDKKPGDGCWEWAGSRNAYGYGSVPRNLGGPVGAHRFAWMLENGPIPDGLFVCHRCDNPPCVRLDHLFLGTAAENSADAARKGRMKGGKHPPQNRIKRRYGETFDLSDIRLLRDVEREYVEEVIQRKGKELPEYAIAIGLGISPTTLIRLRKRWEAKEGR